MAQICHDCKQLEAGQKVALCGYSLLISSRCSDFTENTIIYGYTINVYVVNIDITTNVLNLPQWAFIVLRWVKCLEHSGLVQRANRFV